VEQQQEEEEEEEEQCVAHNGDVWGSEGPLLVAL
jgi:hypothetical protein